MKEKAGMVLSEIMALPSGKWHVRNVCIWYDGTLRPVRGHNGSCRWFYDGQIYYHLTNLE